MERKTVSTPAGDIAYIDEGQGPPALFIHGVFLNGDLWRNVIPGVKDVRRCIAVDLPCHGETRVRDDQELTFDAHADILAGLCDALGLGEVDVVGNDSGGAIAQVFAARHPQRLRTLVLTNCDTHDNIPPPNFQQPVELAFQGQLAPVAAELASNPELARSDLGLGVGYEHPEAVSEDVLHNFLGRYKDLDEGRQIERFLTSLTADGLLKVEPELKQLQVPTLVVWGTADTFFELKWAYWLQETIPGVTEVVELEGAKLFFPDERADELVPLLRRHWEVHP